MIIVEDECHFDKHPVDQHPDKWLERTFNTVHRL